MEITVAELASMIGGRLTDETVADSGSNKTGPAPNLRGQRDGNRRGDADFGGVMIDDDPKGELRLEGQVIVLQKGTYQSEELLRETGRLVAGRIRKQTENLAGQVRN